MTREVYLLRKPKDRKFFGLNEEQMLNLKKPIYGVPDAGDYWDLTIHERLKEDLKLVPLIGDPSFYRKANRDDIDGLMALYVDDMMMAGNQDMQRLTVETAKRFESKPREWDDFKFFGIYFKNLDSLAFAISQKEYVSNLIPVPGTGLSLDTGPVDCTFEKFRSYGAVFPSIGVTRADLSFVINRAAQVTENTFSLEKIREINKGIMVATESVNQRLTYRTLEKETLHIRVYADSSFANNYDLSTQMGHVILLCDQNNAFHFLDYASKKCKRIVRSVLGGQVYAMAEAFDGAYMLKCDLEYIYKMAIPFHTLTDSSSMFVVLTKSSSTTERRLMIYKRALQEAYKQEDITHVGLVASEHNMADPFTKLKPNIALKEALQSGFDNTPILQWIFRTKASSL